MDVSKNSFNGLDGVYADIDQHSLGMRRPEELTQNNTYQDANRSILLGLTRGVEFSLGRMVIRTLTQKETDVNKTVAGVWELKHDTMNPTLPSEWIPMRTIKVAIRKLTASEAFTYSEYDLRSQFIVVTTMFKNIQTNEIANVVCPLLGVVIEGWDVTLLMCMICVNLAFCPCIRHFRIVAHVSAGYHPRYHGTIKLFCDPMNNMIKSLQQANDSGEFLPVTRRPAIAIATFTEFRKSMHDLDLKEAERVIKANENGLRRALGFFVTAE